MLKRRVGCISIVLLAPLMWGGLAFADDKTKGRDEYGKTADGKPCNPQEDIMLNTDIPFIGRCIKKDPKAEGNISTMGNAFPRLMGGLIRVVMAVVVIVAFLAILIGGFMVAAEGAAQTKQKGLQLIKLAVAGLILVGLSGIILNLINPNFFKTTTGSLIAPIMHTLF